MEKQRIDVLLTQKGLAPSREKARALIMAGAVLADEVKMCIRDRRMVEKLRFDRLGVFAYSPEEGTKAAEFVDQIPEDIKESRRQEIMEIQQGLSLIHICGWAPV